MSDTQVLPSPIAGKLLKNLSNQFNDFYAQLGADAKDPGSKIVISAGAYTTIVNCIRNLLIGESSHGFELTDDLRFKGVKITIRTDDAPED